MSSINVHEAVSDGRRGEALSGRADAAVQIDRRGLATRGAFVRRPTPTAGTRAGQPATAAREVREVDPGSADAGARDRTVQVQIGHERVLEVVEALDAVVLRVESAVPAERIEIEIRFEANGPVVRTHAAALEIDAPRSLAARCGELSIIADGDVDLVAGRQIRLRAGDDVVASGRNVSVDASPGQVHIRANDDVQLLGELILLNCDRLPPMPSWVERRTSEPETLPLTDATGDDEVVSALRREHGEG